MPDSGKPETWVRLVIAPHPRTGDSAPTEINSQLYDAETSVDANSVD